ncbi:hypothetical protein CK203_042081 [Vitis vinifera]|uniref:Uncharacterized protein n=1 Tax=Vitis vinifera TaxID=29760 RepID=A0A438HHF1_VITVI|nr:hypothetical protein CK203_042081 [Vitis vinifera]
MPKTRGGHTSAPQSSERAAPVRAPLDAPPHLDDSASQSRYHTRRASATPVALLRFHFGVLLQRKPRLQSQESPLEHLGIHSLSRHPNQTPYRPSVHLLRATQIAGPNHFMPRHILSTLCCASRLTCQDSYSLLERLRGFPYPYAPADPTTFRRWAPLSEWGHDPQAEPRRHCRESFSLDQWTQLLLHQHSPELPEPREVHPTPSTSAPSEPVPDAASSDALPAVPPTVEPPITIPGSEYRALLASFQTLTTTQMAIMERMDHFQIQQGQQTLILCEIPAAPRSCATSSTVAMPSSVPAEDPSYPPEEPTT